MSRRVVLVVAVAAVLAFLLVAVGRWERSHRADVQNRGIARVVAAVGPVASTRPSYFRYLPEFQCLLYARGGDRLALEVCVDPVGRVLEAIDRRRKRTIWSLRDDPGRATVRVDRAALDRWLVRLGLPARLVRAVHGG